tara:strand:- start:348 stop:1496 length:1149 start_codon:yes stop_codon:yes gene_type:complete
MRKSAPLTSTALKAALHSFKKICQDKSLILPEGLSLKNPEMFFKLETCLPYYITKKILSDMTRRDTSLSIMISLSEKGQYTQQKVGQIRLIEYPHQETKKFSLHFINISDGYQSKGFGGTALDLTILLTQHLSQQSAFYDQLTLQCADYDGEKDLGNVPYRLSYYLNHGFQIATETISYMRHLDLSYFIHSITTDNFDSFLNSYADGNYGTTDLPLNTFRDKTVPLLRKLKKQHPLSEADLDERCLQIAESSSSDASNRILDRLFYDDRLMDDFYESEIEGKIYVMHLNVAHWGDHLAARQQLKLARPLSLSNYSYNPEELNSLLKEIADLHGEMIQPTVKRTERLNNPLFSLIVPMKKKRKLKVHHLSTIETSAKVLQSFS